MERERRQWKGRGGELGSERLQDRGADEVGRERESE
jgi:hypothetical protein